MTHLSPGELVDAMDELLAPERRSHLDACEHCLQQLSGVASALGDARQVSVPEPSPLFWQHFSNRVRRAVDAEPAPVEGLAGSWRWPALAPLGALALVLMTLVFAIPVRDDRVSGTVVDATDVDLSDDGWMLVADMMGDVDLDTARAAGVAPRPAAVEQALLELTPDERRELTRLLTAELQRVKS